MRKQAQSFLRWILQHTYNLYMRLEKPANIASSFAVENPTNPTYGYRQYLKAWDLPADTAELKQTQLLLEVQDCSCYRNNQRWCNTCTEKVLYSRWITAAIYAKTGRAILNAIVYNHRCIPLLKPQTTNEAILRDVETFNAHTVSLLGHLKETALAWSNELSAGKII